MARILCTDMVKVEAEVLQMDHGRLTLAMLESIKTAIVVEDQNCTLEYELTILTPCLPSGH